MTRLNWDAFGERFYETGVDRGVLYLANQNGVAWPGLISVNESPTGGEPRPYYMDGQKYLNLSTSEEFEATINAFSSPPEFGPCEGVSSIQNGLFATQQPRTAFGFSYRTRVGNDVDGVDHGYKIHLVYNALSGPSERSRNTLGDSADPTIFSWPVTTLPPSLTGRKPTAHLVIDSRSTPRGLLAYVEDVLYGSDAAAPRLPMPQELADLFQSPGPLIAQNLVMNPTGQVATGVILWENIVINPAALETYSEAVVRKNYCPNPRASTSTANWTTASGGSPGPGTTQFERIGDAFADSNWAFRLSATDLNVVNDVWGVYFDVPAVPGSIWSARIDGVWREAGPAGVSARLGIEFRSATSSLLFTAAPLLTATPIGAVTEMKRENVTAPAGTTTVRVYVQILATAASVSEYLEFRFKNVLLENRPSCGPFFDGASAPPSSDYTISWTGPIYLSTSEMRAPSLYSWFGASLFATPAYQCSVPWTDSGKAVRADAVMSAATLYLSAGGYEHVAPGDIVTALAKACVPNVPASVQLAVQFLDAANASIDIVYLDSLPVDPGEVADLRYISSPAPAGTDSARLLVYLRGATGGFTAAPLNADLIVGDGALIPGEYAGPFFYGDSPATADFTYAWTGVPNQSHSQQKAYDPEHWGGNPRGKIWRTSGGGLRYLVSQNGYSLGAHYVLYDSTPRMPVIPGEEYTALTRVEELPTDPVNGAFITYQWYDVTGAFISDTDGERAYVDANGTVVIRSVATAPANAAGLRCVIYPNGVDPVTPGTEYVVRYLNVVPGDYSGPPFDGSTPDGNGDTYLWTGTPDFSISEYHSWN